MRYLVTLQPLMPYYFGGEHNFSNEGAQKYYAKSLLFPQPTTILGMVRKQILLKVGLLKSHKRGEWIDKKNKQAAKELVGDKAFRFEEPIKLGIIEEISEPFLLDNKNNKIVHMPFDEELSPVKNEKIHASLDGQKRAYIDFGIDPKNFDTDKFMSPQGNIITQDAIFYRTTIAGNKKQSKEEGFFMKDCYMLTDDFCFAFYLQLSQEMELDGLVEVGGDRSKFLLKARKDKECKEPILSKKDGFERIILTSPTLLEKEAQNFCDFILGKRTIARAIERSNKKTNRYYLLEPGSVLYANDKDVLKKLLDKEHLQKIGMNRYKEQ